MHKRYGRYKSKAQNPDDICQSQSGAQQKLSRDTIFMRLKVIAQAHKPFGCCFKTLFIYSLERQCDRKRRGAWDIDVFQMSLGTIARAVSSPREDPRFHSLLQGPHICSILCYFSRYVTNLSVWCCISGSSLTNSTAMPTAG